MMLVPTDRALHTIIHPPDAEVRLLAVVKLSKRLWHNAIEIGPPPLPPREGRKKEMTRRIFIPRSVVIIHHHSSADRSDKQRQKTPPWTSPAINRPHSYTHIHTPTATHSGTVCVVRVYMTLVSSLALHSSCSGNHQRHSSPSNYPSNDCPKLCEDMGGFSPGTH